MYLKKSDDERNALPTMYQAIHDLDVKKEDLVALNNSRKLRDNAMVLSDAYIDALYMEEDEMLQALIHPLALYYNGKIYTWEQLCSTSLTDTSVALPISVIDAYVNHVMSYCVDQQLISRNHIERYFGVEYAQKLASSE